MFLVPPFPGSLFNTQLQNVLYDYSVQGEGVTHSSYGIIRAYVNSTRTLFPRFPACCAHHR
jgi:hypothetical protein